jgi:CRISPR system Cascade subunit CasD
MQLAAPMQSWGVQSHFTHRDTGLEPSKSGVIGLLCAALGRDRTEPIDDLAALRMAVRVDREGILKKDYHTAKDVMRAGGKPFVQKGLKPTELSDRFYLADAAFLVGLLGPGELMQKLHHALQHPHWLLFLGRKAFVPGRPIALADGWRDGDGFQDLLNVLTHPEQGYPRIAPQQPGFDPGMARVVADDPAGESVRSDQPVSFAKGNRQFLDRRVRTIFCALPPMSLKNSKPDTRRS